MSTQTQRPLNAQSVNAIMRKRSSLPVSMVGKKVVMTIQGDGNVIDVKNAKGELVLSTLPGQEGIVLQKKIFNVKTNSQLALSNPRNRQYLIDAAKAEKAGDVDAANELYNQFLNSCQVSFGIILPSAIADKLANGVDISATVQKIDTENGSLLTIDTSTISIKEPEVLDNGTSFDVSAFLGIEEKEETAPDQFAGMDRAALKAYAVAHPELKVVVAKAMSDEDIRVALRAATEVEA